VAAFSTLVSNPLTYAPIGVLAYKTGSALLGETVNADAAASLQGLQTTEDDDSVSWAERAKAIGKPLFLGLFVFAVIGGITTWLLVNAVWRASIVLKRRRRRC
jgi:uncharacterized protein (DUF2062 family)